MRLIRNWYELELELELELEFELEMTKETFEKAKAIRDLIAHLIEYDQEIGAIDRRLEKLHYRLKAEQKSNI